MDNDNKSIGLAKKLREQQEENERVLEKLREQQEENERLQEKLREQQEENKRMYTLLVRTSLLEDIRKNKFTSREDLIRKIDEGNFNDTNIERRKIDNTDEVLKEASSVYSVQSGHINISSFDKRMVFGSEDQMKLVPFKRDILEIVRSRYDNNDEFEEFVKTEVLILEKIRGCLMWYYRSNNDIGEVITQKIFILYCSDLLKKIQPTMTWNIINANSNPLSANISVSNGADAFETKKLSGFADVAVVCRPIEIETIDIDEELKSSSSVLGELKKSFGTLFLNRSGIIKATNQQLGELLAIAKMRRQEAKGSEAVTISFLSDLFSIRIAIRVDTEGTVYYPVTSLYEDAHLFVACIMFLTLDLSIENDIKPNIDLNCEFIEQHINDVGENGTDVGDNDHVKDDDEDYWITNVCNNLSIQSQNSEKYTTLAFSAIDSNIILIADDAREEAKEKYLEDLQSLAKWEASRFGRPYLSAENLSRNDRIIMNT